MNNKWSSFRNGDFAVHCSTEQQADMLTYLVKYANINIFMDNSCYEDYKKNTCYKCKFKVGYRPKLVYADIDYYKENNVNIIEFDDFMKGE